MCEPHARHVTHTVYIKDARAGHAHTPFPTPRLSPFPFPSSVMLTSSNAMKITPTLILSWRWWQCASFLGCSLSSSTASRSGPVLQHFLGSMSSPVSVYLSYWLASWYLLICRQITGDKWVLWFFTLILFVRCLHLWAYCLGYLFTSFLTLYLARMV